MPSSRSCSDERENSASHVGNLETCWLRPRPMTVRKVWTSGMKGVGRGISGIREDAGAGGVAAAEEAARIGCVDGWRNAERQVIGARAVRSCCGLRRGCGIMSSFSNGDMQFIH